MSELSTKAIPSRKRSTVFQAVGGYINTGIVVAQGLLLIPLYLYYIGSHTYGLWLASGGILGMLMLMNFGISSMLIQRIASAYGKKEFARAGAYFFNGMIVYLFICLLFGLVGWGVSAWVPIILKVDGDDAELLQGCFQIAVIAMTIGILNECLRSFSQALLRPVVPMVGIAVGRILGIAVTVWMLFSDFGLWAIPMGLLITEGAIFIINLINVVSLFRWLGAKISLDKNIIKEYFKTAPFLLMATTGNTLSQQSEPLLITLFLTPEITTAYMVTRRAADIVFQMLNIVVGSTMGSFAHLVGASDLGKIATVAKQLLMLSFSIGVVGFATFVAADQAFVTLWLGEGIVLDQDIVFWIGVGFLAQAFRGLLGQILYGLDDFFKSSVVILFEGIARIGLAVWLLGMLGIIGIPLALLISSVVAIIILALRLKMKLSLYVSFGSIIRLLFSGVVLYGGAVSISQLALTIDSWLVFALYLAGFMLAIISIYVLINWARCSEIYKRVST